MHKLIFAITIVFLSACAKQKGQAQLPAQRSGPPPAAAKALLPDATSKELEAALQAVVPDPADRSAVLAEMAGATRQLFAWQAALNAQRPPERRLRFDRNMKGIPIEEPFAYNAESVLKDYRDAIDALNPEMRAVVTSPNAPIPAVLATPDDEFETRGKKVFSAYDHAMRWEALSPYIDFYRKRASTDVRGFYFLAKVNDLDGKLARWRELPPADASRYSLWLRGECLNAKSDPDACDKELAAAIASGDLRDFHKTYLEPARAFFNDFFALQEPRTDVTWVREGAAEGPQVPFTRPEKPEMAKLAKGLIEAAWRGDGWQLRLGYTDRADADTAHLVFESGALPHVNKIGGSEITMDDNVPADNEVNSTVFQHEFGHVIGFPDCYVEFYDDSVQKLINYQIDASNIMCSRVGKVTSLHRDAIRKAYSAAARLPSAAKGGTR